MNDKWGKLKVGLVAARNLAPAHVMFVDADDCVHRGLAEYVKHRPDIVGWSFDVGYIHDEGSRWLFRTTKFFHRCGSSAIVRLSLKDFPASESQSSRDFFILSHGHTIIKDGMANRGTPLQELPFVGAVYITNTGENDSGARTSHWQSKRQILKSALAIRPLTKRVRSDMGLYDLT
jgi:hypothetical protein